MFSEPYLGNSNYFDKEVLRNKAAESVKGYIHVKIAEII